MPETADFAYKFAEGMEKTIKTFRQRGGGGDTLVLRIEHERDMIEFDEQLKKASLDDIQELLDETEPRYAWRRRPAGGGGGPLAAAARLLPGGCRSAVPANIPPPRLLSQVRREAGACALGSGRG